MRVRAGGSGSEEGLSESRARETIDLGEEKKSRGWKSLCTGNGGLEGQPTGPDMGREGPCGGKRQVSAGDRELEKEGRRRVPGPEARWTSAGHLECRVPAK